MLRAKIISTKLNDKYEFKLLGMCTIKFEGYSDLMRYLNTYSSFEDGIRLETLGAIEKV